jgi:hypothetical protein
VLNKHFENREHCLGTACDFVPKDVFLHARTYSVTVSVGGIGKHPAPLSYPPQYCTLCDDYRLAFLHSSGLVFDPVYAGAGFLALDVLTILQRTTTHRYHIHCTSFSRLMLLPGLQRVSVGSGTVAVFILAEGRARTCTFENMCTCFHSQLSKERGVFPPTRHLKESTN